MINSRYQYIIFLHFSPPVRLHYNLRGCLPPGPLVRPPQQLGGDQAGRPEVRLRDQTGRGGEGGGYRDLVQDYGDDRSAGCYQ